MRTLISLLCVLLPTSLKRIAMNSILGHEISSSARIGFSLILVDKLVMGPHSEIGQGTICKGLSNLHIGNHSKIGRFNWISAVAPSNTQYFQHIKHRDSSLYLGEHASITARHLVDCTCTVRIGSFSTIAGYYSQLLTHSIDLSVGRQDAHPIEVGKYCFVGTNTVILGGSVLPNFSVLGAKSLLNKQLTDEGHLYAGIPVRRIKALDRAGYFARTEGVVH